MASFRKRSGRWQARVFRINQPAIVNTFDLRADAERWARAVQREIDLGIYLPRNNAEIYTVDTVVRRYLAEVVPLMRGADTEAYRLRNVLAQLGDLTVASLSPQVIATYRDNRLKAVAAGTVLRELNSLSSMLNHARREWGVGISNPVVGVRKPTAPQGRSRRLEEDEERRLMEVLCGDRVRNPWVKPAVQLALETAMRRGELLSLQWQDIDVAKRVAHLRVTKNGCTRDVPLSVKACEVLAGLPRSIDGSVFPVTTEAFKQAFSRACLNAKIADLHFHDLRHEATSRLAQRLPNVIELAAVTGHHDLKMLQRYYHVSASDLALKIG